MKNRNEKGQFIKGTHWRPKSPLWDRDWLYNEYIVNQLSMEEIAKKTNVTEPAVRHWMKKHSIPRRNVSESRKVKHWGNSGPDNPMWNRKGELSPSWKGGVTSERQLLYSTPEWKKSCYEVWRRDNATCQRCGLIHNENKDTPFHIHHLKSFVEYKDLRVNTENLILLCEVCHLFIHSRKNVNKEFIL